MQVHTHYVCLLQIQWIFTAKLIVVGEHIGSQEFVWQ